jgi:branched-chain amino acid transport system substrate-binding protein
VKKKAFLAAIPLAAAVVALAVVSGAVGSSSSVSTLPSSSCGPVFYKGSGSPHFLIASDLPLQGAGRAQLIAMQQSIQFVLEKQFKFKAGNFTVGYQGCDDSTAQTGAWDPAKCSANARAYASEKTLIGILGTFNSGCAKLEVPIVNRAPGGAIAMLSSANTNVGLTHHAPWNSPGEPKIYYPTGVRNYARVAATDDYQGPAAADLMKARGIKSVFILNDNQTFGKGVAQAFQNRAISLHIAVKGFVPWDAKATSYEAIGQQIATSGAQAVYFGGIVCNNGVKLLKDVFAATGKKLFAGPDGWTPYSATLGAGTAAIGMYISYAGQPLSKLGKTGKAYIAAFRKYAHIKGSTPPYSIYQGQSAQVLLNAIARSNGTRRDVIKQMFATQVTNGIMGTFHFDKNGDTCPNKWISFDRLIGGKAEAKYAFVVLSKVKC